MAQGRHVQRWPRDVGRRKQCFHHAQPALARVLRGAVHRSAKRHAPGVAHSRNDVRMKRPVASASPDVSGPVRGAVGGWSPEAVRRRGACWGMRSTSFNRLQPAACGTYLELHTTISIHVLHFRSRASHPPNLELRAHLRAEDGYT